MRRVLGSVRARATLAATLVVAVALVAAGAAVLLSLRSNLIDQTDTQADSAARQVASELAADIPYAKVEMPDADDDRPVQIVEEGGRLVAVSEDLEEVTGTGVESVRPQGGSGTGGSGAREDGDDGQDGDDADDEHDPAVGEISEGVSKGSGSATVDGDTEDYRFVAVEATTPKDVTYTVYAGAPLQTEESAVDTALTTMLIGLPVLLLTVSGVTYLVTRRALRPVEGIRGEMAAITHSEDLARRVPVPDTHDEVARLARTTNETLAALEASVERQRRFVADASHELRSPIASLRTQLEVGVAHPELLDVEGAVEDTVRLQRLAADLLLLARLDAGERPTDARFDLAALVREEVSQRSGDRIAVTVDAEPVEVAGSRGQLARVLGNLLDNAQRHTHSSVTVTARRADGQAVLAVADDGKGVPAAERERVFERFVRLDEARARDDGGAGLGLAIARDVAARHGGSLTVHEAPTGGARFELRLPIS